MKLAVGWILLVLALGLQIHSAFLLGQQLSKPAHYHQQGDGALDTRVPGALPQWLSGLASDIAEGHRHSHPAKAVAPATGHHAQIADHDHEPGESGVVYVSQQGDEPDEGNAVLRASSADPFLGLLRPALEFPRVQAKVTVTAGIESRWSSHTSSPPEKPPRV